jgi:hypothetical protein
MNYDLNPSVAVFLGLRCHLSNSWYYNWTSPNAQGVAFANTVYYCCSINGPSER